MKKDSIIKMLEALNAKATALNIFIVETILNLGGFQGITRLSLIDLVLKGSPKEVTRGKIQGALHSLNCNGVILFINIKGTAWVDLTIAARWEYKKEDIGEKTAEFLADCETNLKDISDVLRTEADKFKRKAAKKTAKLLNNLADKLREK